MRLLELIYLLLPAYCANMAAPFARFWPGWNRPINAHLLGEHKTVIGFAFGVAAGVLVALVQPFIDGRVLPVDRTAWLMAGLAQGFGAMAGDALKSLFKRRVGIAPGHSWMPADQLDFVIGALLLAWPWLGFDAMDVVLVLAFTFFAHIAVNHIAFWLRIRDVKW